MCDGNPPMTDEQGYGIRELLNPDMMRRAEIAAFILVFLCHFLSRSGHACTAFLLDHDGQLLMGANLDWCYGDGLVIVNKRGLRKTAIHNPKKHRNPVTWKSRYGSVTFTIYGREWTWGGMNEAGLACSTINFEETQYHLPDQRPSIHAVQYLQYQLDSFGTVEEVIGSEILIRIRSVPKGLGSHYFFSDRFGNCAVLEFLKGKLVQFSAKAMPVKTLTNEGYEKSLEYSAGFKCFGGKKRLSGDDSALNRFVRAACMLKNYSSNKRQPPIDYAFEILKNVAFEHHTETDNQWNIVYDIRNLQIHFRTKNNRKTRYINLRAIPFTCTTPTEVLDIQESLSGNITHQFNHYTNEINRKMFEKAAKKVHYQWNVSEKWLDAMSRYPDSFRCED